MPGYAYHIRYSGKPENDRLPDPGSIITLDCFRPEGGDYHPSTSLSLCHDQLGLMGCFHVRETCVLARYHGFQQPVSEDSCVELFLQPRGHGGYFNFEFNALGAMLLYWIEDPVRDGKGFRRYTVLPDRHCQQVSIWPSLNEVTGSGHSGPQAWSLAFRIPVSLLEVYAGSLGELSGQHWRGNAYKCGDETSHPHWASWAPITGALDFHQPRCFGDFIFE